jgi:hypothetical protein
MGISAERGERGAWARLGLFIGSALAFLALIVPTQPALATFHLVSIGEVHPASAALPDSSYIELQAYADGQNFVAGHAIDLFDSAGNPAGTFTFPSDLPGTGATEQTMLVGDDGVKTTFGVEPDLVSAGFNLSGTGGAACWAESLDCVSWGHFEGSTPSPSGVPADGSGIPDGKSIVRRISGGNCANRLDGLDDTNDSDEDFVDATPTPQSYATVPPPASCTPPAATPITLIDSTPPAFTNSTGATFSFHADPAGAGRESTHDKR